MNKVKLGEICDLSIGFVGTVTTQYENGGVPFFRTLNIKPYKILSNDLKTITREFHDSQSKSKLYTGDIAMVHTGVPGICCVIPEEYNDSNCIDMIVIKPHKNKVDENYLCAYMNTIGYKHIEKQQVGCIQKHFNLADAQELEIFIPDIEKQRKIGNFVKLINDKISNAEKINKEIEDLIQKVFNKWFFQLDYPGSSEEKKCYAHELNKDIPNSWSVKKIDDIVEMISGYSFQSESYDENGEYKLYTIKNVQNGYINDEVDNKIKILPDNMPSEIVLSEGDILMSLTGNVGRIGIVYEKNALLNQRVLKLKPKIPYSFIYALFRTKYMYNQLDRIATGTSQKNLSPINMGNLNILVPNEVILNKFDKIFSPLIRMITNNYKQIYDLKKLREEVFPMLISEQIKIEE